MKTEVQDLGGSQKRITFEIPSDEVLEEINKYCKKLAKEVDVRGFRRGKAPVGIIKQYFREQIKREVTSQLVSSSIEKALKDHSITPLGEPEIEAGTIAEGEAFVFSVKMDVKPVIDVKDYTGIEVQQEEAKVEEREVELALENLRKAHAEMKAIEEERPTAEGDIVLVDYEARIAGKKSPAHVKEDIYIEIGSGVYLQEIEEGLVGVRAGEKKDINIQFSEDFAEKELAGNTVTYTFNIKNIFQKELPDLDDEFAKDVGPYQSLEELKEELRKELLKEKEKRIRRRVNERILDRILERNPIEAPRSLVDERFKQLMSEAQKRILNKGISIDKDAEDYRRLEENLSKLAEIEVKRGLILEAITQKEGIEVTDEDMNKKIEEIAKNSGQSIERVRGELQRNNGLEDLRRNLREEKTLDFLHAKAKIETVDKIQGERDFKGSNK